MGRTSGRKPIPLRIETTSALMQAVARDFQNRRIEQSARARLRERLADPICGGQRKRREPAPDGGFHVVAYGPYLQEPRIERTPEKQAQVERERERLSSVLPADRLVSR